MCIPRLLSGPNLRPVGLQIPMPGEGDAHRETETETDSQTDRQKQRETHRQTDRQIASVRKRERDTETGRSKER